jgi:hypothetical protein
MKHFISNTYASFDRRGLGGCSGDQGTWLPPTVLGELLDQMLLVEGFYCSGPVICILPSGEEWLVAWFPVNTKVLEQFNEMSTQPSSTVAETPSVRRNDSAGYR